MLEKVCGDSVKDVCPEKNVFRETFSINSFIKLLKYNKRELQTKE